MARRVTDTSKKARRVRVTSRTARKVEHDAVAEGLGVTAVGRVQDTQHVARDLHALQLQLRTALRSRGGRPGLAGAQRRQKIPMANADWKRLEALAESLRADGLATTPGQVAAKLLHDAIAAVGAADDVGDIPRARPYEGPGDSGSVASRLRESGPQYASPQSSRQSASETLDVAPVLHGRIPTDDELRSELQDALTVVIDARAALHRALPVEKREIVVHHMTEVLERLRNVALILRRLMEGRARLSIDNLLGDRPSNHELQVDSESLWLFGAILLDQWAQAYAHCVTLPFKRPEEVQFHELVTALDRQADSQPLLAPSERVLARWLHFWLRTYRSKFLVHAKRPRQRSAIGDVVGPRFELFTMPLLSPEERAVLDAQVLDLWRFTPDWLKAKDAPYWERRRPGRILERVVENIGSVDKQSEREHIASLAEQVGITAPTFQVLGTRLARFVVRGTKDLVALVTTGTE